MIQDILPRHLDNQFRWLTPQKSDIILLFEGSSVLAKAGLKKLLSRLRRILHTDRCGKIHVYLCIVCR